MPDVGRILRDSTLGSFTWKVEDFSYLQHQDGHWILSPGFSALGAEWWFRIVHTVKVDGDSRTILSLRMCPSVIARFEFGIRGKDDAELMACSGETLYSDNLFGLAGLIMLPSDWQVNKDEFAPGGVFSVFCRLRVRGAPRRASATPGNDTGTQTENFLPVCHNYADGPSKSCDSPGAHKVVENLKGLLSNEETCDVTLKVQNQEFKAHKALLVARSRVFRSMFSHQRSEKLGKEVRIIDCDTDAFRIFLRHVYTGDAEDLSINNVFDVFSIANKYDATELKTQCEDCIASNITVETVCDVVAFSLRHGDVALLENASQFFTKHFSQILLTNKWQCFLRDHATAANELLIRVSNFYVPPE